MSHIFDKYDDEDYSKYTEPYSHPRWNDMGTGRLIGHNPISEEERERKSRGFYEFVVRDYKRRIKAAETEEEKQDLTERMEKFKKEHNL